MSSWVYVTNLPSYYDEYGLIELFCDIGRIKSVCIKKDNLLLKSSGFVKFDNEKYSKLAASKKDGYVIGNNAIRVYIIWNNKDTLTTVKINNLESSISTKELQDLFSPYGDIVDIRINNKNDTIQAFISFTKVDYALQASQEMNGQIIFGYSDTLKVALLNPDARNLKWKRNAFQYISIRLPSKQNIKNINDKHNDSLLQYPTYDNKYNKKKRYRNYREKDDSRLKYYYQCNNNNSNNNNGNNGSINHSSHSNQSTQGTSYIVHRKHSRKNRYYSNSLMGPLQYYNDNNINGMNNNGYTTYNVPTMQSNASNTSSTTMSVKSLQSSRSSSISSQQSIKNKKQIINNNNNNTALNVYYTNSNNGNINNNSNNTPTFSNANSSPIFNNNNINNNTPINVSPITPNYSVSASPNPTSMTPSPFPYTMPCYTITPTTDVMHTPKQYIITTTTAPDSIPNVAYNINTVNNNVTPLKNTNNFQHQSQHQQCVSPNIITSIPTFNANLPNVSTTPIIVVTPPTYPPNTLQAIQLSPQMFKYFNNMTRQSPLNINDNSSNNINATNFNNTNVNNNANTKVHNSVSNIYNNINANTGTNNVNQVQKQSKQTNVVNIEETKKDNNDNNTVHHPRKTTPTEILQSITHEILDDELKIVQRVVRNNNNNGGDNKKKDKKKKEKKQKKT